MSSRRERGLSATWEASDVVFFCDTCIKEIEVGNRPTTHFNKEGWNNLTTQFQTRTGKLYDRVQLKNKWDQLKKEWKLWRELKRGATGLGWNPITKTIDASDQWWMEKLQANPSAKKFRHAGIPPELEEKLEKMFSHVVACGDDVWMPSTGIVPPELVDERIGSDEEDTQATMNDNSKFLGESSTSKRKKNRCRTGSGEGSKQMLISQVLNLVASRQAVPPPTRSVSIKEAFEELSRIPEIYDDLEFYDFATEFIRDKSSRESFMSCPSERKVWWLKRRFLKSQE